MVLVPSELLGELPGLKGKLVHETSVKASPESSSMSPSLVSEVVRFCVGGFRNIKGKQGTGEEENVSELQPRWKRGRLTLPWVLAVVGLSSSRADWLPSKSSRGLSAGESKSWGGTPKTRSRGSCSRPTAGLRGPWRQRLQSSLQRVSR